METIVNDARIYSGIEELSVVVLHMSSSDTILYLRICDDYYRARVKRIVSVTESTAVEIIVNDGSIDLIIDATKIENMTQIATGEIIGYARELMSMYE